MSVVTSMLALGLLSRKEKRKETRKAKGLQRSQAWAVHQAYKKNAPKKRKASQALQGEDSESGGQPAKVRRNESAERPKSQRFKGTKRKRSRTKFEQYLAMESLNTNISAQQDLALEKRLAKKLKVKKGLLRGASDGLSELLEDTVALSDFVEVNESDHKLVAKKLAKKKFRDEEVTATYGKSSLHRESLESEEHVENDVVESSSEEDDSTSLMGEDIEIDDSVQSMSPIQECSEDDEEEQEFESEKSVLEAEGKTTPCAENDLSNQSSVKYVAPHLRDLAMDSYKGIQVQRRIRGLLNRLSEANVETIAHEFSVLFQVHGRRIVSENVTNEVLLALCSGPRGNEQYAAVFAAFVAGIAASVGIDFGAKFLASLADNFEDQYKKGDSLAVRNLMLMLSYLYTFKLVTSDLVYDLMRLLCKRMEELDVATILVILQTCGVGFRSDDPTAMKEFVFDVQSRSEELKAAALQSGASVSGGKRMHFMLETIFEIKNNKRRMKPESSSRVRLTKWLKKLRVEDIQLRALTWKKLIDPNKKGQWWITGGADESREGNAVVLADIISKEVAETEKMLELAASQGMNTDIRRAVFSVVMSAEDYLDAFEKILRLKLTGKQDREVLRVIVECCLQEKFFNKYYSLLASKLCHHDKNHKFTLQYCLWDQFKQLDTMGMNRIANLAHLLADLIGTSSLPLSVVKVMDLSDPKAMTPKIILHFRIFFKVLLTEYCDKIVWNAFTRIACSQEFETLRNAISVFIHQHFIKEVKKDGEVQQKTLLLQRCHMATKALANSSGVQWE